MAVEIMEIVQLLKREYLFQGLGDQQLLWIAAQFKPITVPRETTVIEQGEPGDSFYFVYQGSLRVVQRGRRRGQVRELKVLRKGDFFGEEALLFNRPRSASLTTIEQSMLLRMDDERFFEMLDAYPTVREKMLATAESRRLARSNQFDFLGADEVIYFISRKHVIFLFLKLLAPILLGVAALPMLAFAISMIATATPFMMAVLVGVGFFMFIISLLWGLWSFLDWGNDYYVVTSERVLWLEKVIGLYDSRREAPLETILSVNVRTSQLGRILDYGKINVRTFTGGIEMVRADQPYRFASFVEGFKERAKQLSKEEEAKAMEQALEQALTRSLLRLDDSRVAVPDLPPPIVVKPEQPKKRVSWRQRWRNFLKVRYEENGVITYRKHWFQLFKKAWLPGLLMLLFILAASGVIWQEATSGFFIFSGLVWSTLGLLIFLILFTWLTYEYFDWSNDIYRLTPDQILDIERKPLGQEQKKTAPLGSIQSIEHERENFLGVLLNFGNVNINVGKTDLTFHGVFNPDQVHQDVADYREALNRRNKEKEKNQERDRMVEWLVTFYGQTEGFNGHNDDALDETSLEEDFPWVENVEDEPEWDEFSG